MAVSFYFYDLETSGLNPKEARIMQFAGQRTDEHLRPIGEPHNILVAMSDDMLPDPDAILVTGITPQQTRMDGVSEYDFLQIFMNEIATPDTIFMGYNTIRFDDEFMRYTLYRNFYDPYEWQWMDGRGKWDLLDVVRMTRALRPDGIQWPRTAEGAATNRLELITQLNGLDHKNAHDALSDVQASIEVARLIRTKQRKLWDYLFSIRNKRDAANVITSGNPFVYTSGTYQSEYEKTAIVQSVATLPQQQGAMVYDLRQDPSDFFDLDTTALADRMRWKIDEGSTRLPVKAVQFNRCPAVAPIGVLDDSCKTRLHIDLEKVKRNSQLLNDRKDFTDRVLAATLQLEEERKAAFKQRTTDVDGQLYDKFITDADKQTMRAIRVASPQELIDYADTLQDTRLKQLLPLYKARNFRKKLTSEEREVWEGYRVQKLLSGRDGGRMGTYVHRISELLARPQLNTKQRYILEELQLYAESIMPDATEL